MKKNWIKWVVFIASFIVAAVGFSLYMNQGSNDMTVEMKEATLPIVRMKIEGQSVNEMHGYTQKMAVESIRDSVTPIGEDRAISIELEKYGQEIMGISFEVRSLDGKRLIENTVIEDYEDDKDRITATFHIKDLIEQEQEYNLGIIVSLAENQEAYYYTRIIQQDTNALQKIEFVQNFHYKTYQIGFEQELAKYMEPNTEGDNTTFQKVTIHSSVNQLTWGDMEVTEQEAPSVTICEIGKQTASIVLQYQVSVTEGKNKNLYRVNEYFRIRHTTEHFYLLDYERTMREVFTMDKSSFANNKIMLGIQDSATQIMESEGGNVLAFSNDGRLYSYNVSENKFAQLFAFYDEKHQDIRSMYQESSIRIFNVEENGNISFMVYGYMNRGIHEGESGIEVCYYSSMLNTVEEQVFIHCTQSPSVLRQDISKLAYISKDGILYIYLDGTIYRVDTETRSYKKVTENLQEDSFFVSESNQMVVWPLPDEYGNSQKMILMNLNTEEQTEIDAGTGTKIRAIGFMTEDLVYGHADEADIATDSNGITVFPMKEVVIRSQDGTIRKRYHNDSSYVVSGIIEGNQLTLKRIKKTADENGYAAISDDQITSNNQELASKNQITTAVTNTFETINQIEVKKEINQKSLKFLTPKDVLYEGSRTIEMENNSTQKRYIVHEGLDVTGIYSDEAKAVSTAYTEAGTVLDELGNEIYKRGELLDRNQIMAIKEDALSKDRTALAVCLDTLLQYEGVSRNTEFMLQSGQNADQILSQSMKDTCVLNLMGCSLDSVLYYVNQDIPVLTTLGNGQAVLIIGFNEQNVVLFDPTMGKIYKKGMNDSRTAFEETGNNFVTYIKTESED